MGKGGSGSLFFRGDFYVRAILVFRFFSVGDRMRKAGYKRVVSLLILAFVTAVSPVLSYAQAQPAVVPTPGYTGKVNNAVGEVVNAKMGGWGFSANDPRYTATARSMSGKATVIGGAALAGGASVSWPVVVTAAGVAVVVAGAVKLYQSLTDGYEFNWQWNADGSVSVFRKAPQSYYRPNDMPNLPPVAVGSQVFMAYYSEWDPVQQKAVTKGSLYASDPVVLAVLLVGRGSVLFSSCSERGWPSYQCDVRAGSDYRDFPSLGKPSMEYVSSSPVSCPTGICDGRPPLPAVSTSTSYATASAAVSGSSSTITEDIKVKPVSNEAVAAAANAVWKASDAAASGGIPWSVSDPITPQDVANWAATPSGAANYPTVGDWLGPANASSGSGSIGFGGGALPGGATGGGSPGTGTNPGTIGGTSPAPAPAPAPVTPGSGTEINWGPNPNIGAPRLETTPSADSIVKPIFDLMPDLKNFAVPAHNASCPTAGFKLYGHDYLVDAHCGLLDQNRSLIGACMILAFTLASAFIVLRA